MAEELTSGVPGKRRKINHAARPTDRLSAIRDFKLLAALIEEAIEDGLSASDSIQLCGDGPLEILVSRPEVALVLAQEKAYQWPFKDVPECWLRLCEDASLLVAARAMARFAVELEGSSLRADSIIERTSSMLSEVVKIIDQGISLSGQPRRSSTTKSCFNIMAECFVLPSLFGSPDEYAITTPPPLISDYEISLSTSPDLERFQLHIDATNTALKLTGLIDDWPAMQRWHDPRYLLRATLDGRRIALVEIGSSYADAAMRQALMPVGEFLRDYVLDDAARETGYIAQHDLLGHVEMLSNDVLTPEICYTNPPRLPETASKSRDSDQPPRRNVWVGPEGTKSPFHTDPDANVYCQVVGFKYFRLISSDQSDKMYPRGADELGLDLSNQSKVTAFSFAERRDLSKIAAEGYPLFAQASYQETILGPGQCLYIPARCWHYAESLSTSIGVNFWWT